MSFAVEYPQRRYGEMMRAVSSQRNRAAAQTCRVHRYVVVAEVAIEQRGFDILPFASAFAMEQRGQDRRQRVHARADVAQSDRWQRWRALALANHAEHA